MDRNHLKGKEGDRIKTLLGGCGANMIKLLVAFSFAFLILKKYLNKSARLAGWPGTLHPYLARVT